MAHLKFHLISLLVMSGACLGQSPHILEGVSLFNQGQFSAARRAFERVLEENPVDRVSHLYLGRILLAQGDPKGALGFLQVGDDGDCSTAVLIARCWIAQGKLDQGKNYLAKASKRCPRDRTVFYLLANVYRSLGDETSAKSSFQRVREIERWENDEILTLFRLEAAVRSGQPLSSKDIEALFLSQDPQTLYSLGLILEQALDFNTALQAFEKASASGWSQPQSLFHQAYCFFHVGRLEAAYEACKEVLSQDEGSFEALSLLGSIELKRGNLSAAVNTLERAVEIAPDHPASSKMLALLYLRQRRPRESERLILRLAVKDLLAYVILIQSLLEQGEAEKALETCLRALKDFPGAPELSQLLHLLRSKD